MNFFDLELYFFFNSILLLNSNLPFILWFDFNLPFMFTFELYFSL